MRETDAFKSNCYLAPKFFTLQRLLFWATRQNGAVLKYLPPNKWDVFEKISPLAITASLSLETVEFTLESYLFQFRGEQQRINGEPYFVAGNVVLTNWCIEWSHLELFKVLKKYWTSDKLPTRFFKKFTPNPFWIIVDFIGLTSLLGLCYLLINSSARWTRTKHKLLFQVEIEGSKRFARLQLLKVEMGISCTFDKVNSVICLDYPEAEDCQNHPESCAGRILGSRFIHFLSTKSS